jgi:hypothetical protein
MGIIAVTSGARKLNNNQLTKWCGTTYLPKNP